MYPWATIGSPPRPPTASVTRALRARCGSGSTKITSSGEAQEATSDSSPLSVCVDRLTYLPVPQTAMAIARVECFEWTLGDFQRGEREVYAMILHPSEIG